MEHKNIYQLVLAGVLCAIGLVVPMVMPKVIIGPMSFTLGAHAAIFLAMFISPKVAAAVCLGTTMGFFVTTPLIIAARAATHIIFALVGALIIRRYPNIMESFVAGIGRESGTCRICMLWELSDCGSPFFFSGYMFTQEQLSNGFVMSVIVWWVRVLCCIRLWIAVFPCCCGNLSEQQYLLLTDFVAKMRF